MNLDYLKLNKLNKISPVDIRAGDTIHFHIPKWNGFYAQKIKTIIWETKMDMVTLLTAYGVNHIIAKDEIIWK